MKKIVLALATVAFLNGCNSGSSNSPTQLTQYNLQNYSLTGTQTGNCSIGNNSTINCDSQGTFAGTYKVTFNTPAGLPSAYVVMPPSGDTYGLNISETSGGCTQSAPQGSETYTCNFKIAANGTVQSGHSVNLQINGSLGTANIITINLQ